MTTQEFSTQRSAPSLRPKRNFYPGWQCRIGEKALRQRSLLFFTVDNRAVDYCQSGLGDATK